MQSLEESFGKINFKERKVKENKQIFISDLPVDDEDAYDIDETGEIPSYKKTPTGKARYAPGYWGLKFTTYYIAAFCPKVSTLKKYEHIGPFKDKFILNDQIAVTNKRLNNE